MTANTHIHLPPNFSAFDTVAEAIAAAAAEGVRVLGAGNYYDYSVYDEFARLAREAGVYSLFGMEIVARDAALAQQGVKVNDPGNPGKVYLCGKAITGWRAPNTAARAFLGRIRKGDAARMAAMVDNLAGLFRAAGLDTGLDEQAVIDSVVARHGCAREAVTLQERHVAQAFQQAAFRLLREGERAEGLSRVLGAPPARPDDAVAVQNDIRARLMKAGKPGFVEERFVSVEDARSLVLEMGGIPCYPVIADAATPICPFEAPLPHLIEGVRAWGVHAVEFIPVRNAPNVLAEYVPALRAAGLTVTAGTEHNTRERIPIRPACLGGVPLPPEVEAIFREGAFVLAAHQARVARGEPGFVTETGHPNPAYPSDDARIRAFAEEGEEIVHAALANVY